MNGLEKGTELKLNLEKIAGKELKITTNNKINIRCSRRQDITSINHRMDEGIMLTKYVIVVLEEDNVKYKPTISRMEERNNARMKCQIWNGRGNNTKGGPNNKWD